MWKRMVALLKRGAILESCEKGSGFVKDSELFVLVSEIRER